MKNAKLLALSVTAVAVFATGCGGAEPEVGELSASLGQGRTERMTIVDVALAVNGDTGEFSTLIGALVAADLVGALDGMGQHTVFAPTDAAFLALGLDADNIGELPVDTLTNILLYHVAPGRRPASAVASSSRIRMLNREFAFISDGPMINQANIILTDIATSNGIIHVIDAVLLP